MAGETNMHTPRRIITALILFLVLGGSSAAIAGTTGVDTDSTGLPATWSIPAFRVGDRAEYSASGDEGIFVDESLHMEALPVRTDRDRNGTVHDVLPLAFLRSAQDSDSDWSNWSYEYRIDLATGETVSRDIQFGRASASSSTSLNLVESSRQLESFVRNFEPTRMQCGFNPPFQGVAVALDEPLKFPGCGDTAYVPDRLEEFEGHTVLVFASLNMSHDGEIGYSPELPVPVFVDDEWRADLTLEGVALGSRELPAPAAPKPQPRPTVEFTDVDRYGADMSGLDIDYPIHQALQDVLDKDDDEARSLQAFLDDHPDWFVAGAGYSDERTEDGQGTHGWWMRIVGDATERTVLSYWNIQETTENQVGTVVTGEDQERRHSSQVFEEQETGVVAMPERLPDPGDVAVVWADDAGQSAQDARAWAFNVGCELAFLCDGTEVEVIAGDLVDIRFISVSSDGFGLTSSSASADTASAAAVDGTGVLNEVYFTREESQTVFLGGTTSPEESASADGPLVIPPASGWRLSAPAAAGIGIGAGLLAFAYYFWPALKSAPAFSLFSRLSTPQVLQHPRRKAIMDAVEASPGIHFNRLCNKTQMAQGTLRFHLDHLVREGLVVERKHKGTTNFFMPGTATEKSVASAVASQSPGARTVLDFIREHPGTTARFIADGTGLAVGTVGYHVKKLRDAGVIGSERDGRQVRLTAD